MAADPAHAAKRRRPEWFIANAREEWERAYDEAMRWRDWQTCEILIDEREASDWYVPEEDE